MAKPLAEIVGWSVVAFGVWVVTLSGLTLPEVCFAAACGLVSGVLAYAGRRALGASWSFRWSWLLWPVPVIGALVAELIGLLGVAGRGRSLGRLATIDLPAEDPSTARGREAVATLALCATPGSVVARGDPEAHQLTVHSLLSAGPDLTQVVGR